MKFKGNTRSVGETVIGAEALAIGGESLVRQQRLSQKKRELAAFPPGNFCGTQRKICGAQRKNLMVPQQSKSNLPNLLF